MPTKEKGYNKKILDPACGSGIFLALAYKRLVKRWINETKKQPVFEDLSKLLTDNIFGVELDKKSIKVTAFSLYLSMLDFLDPKDVWLEEDKLFPNLIYDDKTPDKNGSNLFRTDTIKSKGKFEKIKYDIIVGNPPFGTTELTKTIKDYCSKYSFDTQYVIPFIHKSAQLAENGKIALLFNTKILTNNKSTAQNFREWLFNENYVEKVYNLSILRKAPSDFGGHLFSSATVPVSIVFFQKKNPVNLSNTIEYWAPTTFIKNHVAEGVIVDSTDIKYLPRAICQQPKSKIWKIAQWGTLSDYFLFQKLLQFKRIESVIEEPNNGVGFQLLDSTTKKVIENKKIKEVPFIHPSNIEFYITPFENTSKVNECIKTKSSENYYKQYYKSDNIPLIDVFRREGKPNTYKFPHIVIKEGLKNNKVCSSFLNYDCSFNSKTYGIHHNNSSLLKAITALINSDFSSYFLFFHSASWGIEREEIKPEDIKKLPLIPESFVSKIEKSFNEISADAFTNNKLIIREINSKVLEAFGLTGNEIILIKDFINYKQNLFFKGQKSTALKPIAQQKPETIPYAEMLCSEINKFFKSGDLNINARVYNVSPHTPLTLVVIQFVNKNMLEPPVLIEANNDFQKNLDVINEYTITEYAQSIYVRKQVRYYTDDTIYIAKPNQKRFWTRSQAIDDAASIINELMDKTTNEDE